MLFGSMALPWAIGFCPCGARGGIDYVRLLFGFIRNCFERLLTARDAVVLFHFLSQIVQNFPVVREILSPLISIGCVPFFVRKKRSDERRQFIYPVFIFNGIVGCYTHFHSCRFECDILSYPDSYHTELETRTFNHSLLRPFRVCRRLWTFRLIIFILNDYCIINSRCYVIEYIEGYLWRYVEEFSVLTNTQIRQTVDGFVDEPLDFVIFCRFHCSKNLKRQRHCRVVQLL